MKIIILLLLIAVFAFIMSSSDAGVSTDNQLKRIVRQAEEDESLIGNIYGGIYVTKYKYVDLPVGLFTEGGKRRYAKVTDGYVIEASVDNNVELNFDIVSLFTILTILHVGIWYTVGFEEISGKKIGNLLFFLPPLIFMFSIYLTKGELPSGVSEEAQSASLTSKIGRLITILLSINFLTTIAKTRVDTRTFNKMNNLLVVAFSIALLSGLLHVKADDVETLRRINTVRTGLMGMALCYLLTALVSTIL